MGGCCSKKSAAADGKSDLVENKAETIAAAGQEDASKANEQALDGKTESKLTAKSKTSSKIDDESPVSKTGSDLGVQSSLSTTSAISRVTSSRVDKDDEDMRPGSRASQAGSKASMALSNTGSRLDSNYESVASTFGKLVDGLADRIIA